MSLDMESFWKDFEEHSVKETTVEVFEAGLMLMNDVAYTRAATFAEVRAFNRLSSSQMEQIYEELYYFNTMDGDGDAFDIENADQTLMWLNRSLGIAGFLFNLPAVGMQKRRGLL
ncbi:hypothetical protein [Paenibacillus sp. GXUN7292]|uniref:hypothetical protein n=1 Tax=Paenibacillus sp. GXUN7292 TaxID=3422499 RepID=UPI003D7C5A61